MKIAVALTSLVLLASGLVAVQPVAAAVVAPTPVVQGNKLVDSRTGATFVPHGVNIPGLEYSCVQGWRTVPDANEFTTIASWKVNTVRLPLNESCWLGLDGSPQGSTVTQYKADVAAWVNGAVAAGLVVILDLHWNAPAGYLASGQRAMPDERSAAFWTSIATTYAGNKSVLFELFNEPYSRSGFTLTWDCWKNGGCLAPVENDATGTLSGSKYTVTGMQTLVTAVRATGATQPLLLGGLNYSNDLTGWIANKPTDPLNQLVAAWHNYPGQGCSTSCWNSTVTTVAASIPIVTTEFGNTAETTSTVAGNSGNYLVPFMTWADAHGIGYMPWAWWDVGAAEANGNGSDIYALYTGSTFTPKSPSGTKFYNYLASLPSPQAPLVAGSLVKTSTASTIYLVDGTSRLVPLAAMTSATDAGIGPAFTTVSPNAISGYTIASEPLSNAVTCSTQNYISAQSMLWPVDAALVAGLTRTVLEATTCAALPKSSTTITGALFLKSSSAPTIYSISATGTRRAIITGVTLGMLSAPAAPIYLSVGAYYINSLPAGPAVMPPGSLVKAATAPTIYLADGFSRLVPLAAFSSATDAGINSQFFTVAAADLVGLTVATGALSQHLSCAGVDYISGSGKIWPISTGLAAGLPATALESSTCAVLPTSATSIDYALFARTATNGTIYNITPAGFRTAMPSWDAMVTMSAPGPVTYLTVGDYFLSSLAAPPVALTTGMLVKTATAATVYIADSPTSLIPLRTFDSVTELGLPAALTVVPESTIAAASTASAVLSNVVACGSETLVGAEGSATVVDPAAIGSVAVSTLATPLCALIPRSVRDTDPLMVKAPNAATIYLIEAGQKKPIGSGATLTAMSGGVFYTVNAPWVAAIPLGAAIP